MKTVVIAAALAFLVTAAPASAALTIDFEGIASGVSVNGYYSGGAASDGSRTANVGVTFVNLRTLQGIGSPASTIAYNISAPAVVTTAFQFTSLAFDYGFRAVGTVNVFSEENGAGLLLGTATFLANTTGNSSPFASGTVTFAGAAKSFNLVGTNATLALDNITFNAGSVPSAVPELGAWAMMILGMGAVGFVKRRQSRVTTRALFAA